MQIKKLDITNVNSGLQSKQMMIRESHPWFSGQTVLNVDEPLLNRLIMQLCRDFKARSCAELIWLSYHALSVDSPLPSSLKRVAPQASQKELDGDPGSFSLHCCTQHNFSPFCFFLVYRDGLSCKPGNWWTNQNKLSNQNSIQV